MTSNPALDVLTPDERITYSSLHLRLAELSDTDYEKYQKLIKKIVDKNAIKKQNKEIGGKSRRNPSKKAPTSRRRRSSKRKARTTRRKY